MQLRPELDVLNLLFFEGCGSACVFLGGLCELWVLSERWPEWSSPVLKVWACLPSFFWGGCACIIRFKEVGLMGLFFPWRMLSRTCFQLCNSFPQECGEREETVGHLSVVCSHPIGWMTVYSCSSEEDDSKTYKIETFEVSSRACRIQQRGRYRQQRQAFLAKKQEVKQV